MRFGNLEASIHVASKESTLLTTGTPPQCSGVSFDLVGSKSDFAAAEIADCGLCLGESHGSDISTTSLACLNEEIFVGNGTISRDGRAKKGEDDVATPRIVEAFTGYDDGKGTWCVCD
jgi:hypothetical protein